MRNANIVSDRQAKEAEARRMREYNRNVDHANNNTQKVGPTGSLETNKGNITGGTVGIKVPVDKK